MINTSLKLPVLLYHRIISDNESLNDIDPEVLPYCLEKGNFIEQLDFLLSHGYKGITVSKIFGMKKRHNVGITFDDGLESDYFIAFPELKNRNYCATFFIITSCVGRNGYMDWKQIKEMYYEGMEIGSHSVSHPCFLDIEQNVIMEELSQSKKEIEDRLGVRVKSFSVPFGFVNKYVIESAFEVGYENICISKTIMADSSKNHKVYGRYSIRKDDTFDIFKGIVEKDILVLLKINFLEELKSCLKMIMGRKVWLLYREKLLNMRKT